MNGPKKHNRVLLLAGVMVALAFIFSSLWPGNTRANVVEPSQFGYGFNVALWDLDRLEAMGFNWMKLFNEPGSRLPVRVLLRVEANASHMADVAAFGHNLGQLAQRQKGYVDAYEIGNEPNLDATYGWGYGSTNVPPNAAHYVTLLCEAYSQIKAVDPRARVISAGLAPTGRVQGVWNGHSGHNGLFQDEREFFKEMVAAGGGKCLDGVGYHPYGFRANYDAPPDVSSPDPDLNCTNGFCFRGAEKLYQLMQERGLGRKRMWATEVGWLTQPPPHCLNDPGWQGREWQIISPEKQAANLVGAFEYATTHWPWMEAIFVFNLNFNAAPYYPECEQMRYYAVQDRPAEAALAAMPKVSPPPAGEVHLSQTAVSAVITATQHALTHTTAVDIVNVGLKPFTYTVSVLPGQIMTPTVISPTGALAPNEQATFLVQIQSDAGWATGIYTGSLRLTTTDFAFGAPATIPVRLFVFDEIHAAYLPLIAER